MNNTVVLDGDLDLIINGTCALDLVATEDGESGVFTAIREAYPAYTGDMEIEPSAETQTLNTALRTVTGNIVIKPVPNNYGLITWDGSTLTVS